jgi:hypothetical protein
MIRKENAKRMRKLELLIYLCVLVSAAWLPQQVHVAREARKIEVRKMMIAIENEIFADTMVPLSLITESSTGRYVSPIT